ncbi:MAG: hypothetical protein HY013_15315 [Candidatus Solibacter usitatus]|nr:hypothetical protein [Candidatus Solibacter usitatus]
MFGALLFIEDPVACEVVEQLAVESRQVTVYKSFNRFPSSYELARLLNTHSPELVFLDLADESAAIAMASEIAGHSGDAAIIGLSARGASPPSGFSAVLSPPLDLERFQRSIRQAISQARSRVHEHLFAFLPAKAGAGATTVALNLSGCLAEALGKRVLMIEGDIHSGVISELLQVEPAASILDLLDKASTVDALEWRSSVAHALGVDLLLTNRPLERAWADWSGYHHLLQFAAPRYDAILADLPEVVNDAMLEVVRRAGAVFVVTTAELPSLALARHRLRALRHHGVDPGRIRVIVNRWHRNDPKPEQVGELLEQPVASVLPNDYRAVSKATRESGLVDRNTELGKAILSLARKLGGLDGPAPEPSRGLLGRLRGRG